LLLLLRRKYTVQLLLVSRLQRCKLLLHSVGVVASISTEVCQVATILRRKLPEVALLSRCEVQLLLQLSIVKSVQALELQIQLVKSVPHCRVGYRRIHDATEILRGPHALLGRGRALLGGTATSYIAAILRVLNSPLEIVTSLLGGCITCGRTLASYSLIRGSVTLSGSASIRGGSRSCTGNTSSVVSHKLSPISVVQPIKLRVR
jgi:hypothetical protein